MHFRGLLCALAVSAFSLPQSAFAQSQDALAIAAAIEAAGCVVTDENADAVFGSVALEGPDFEAAATQLFEAGILQLQNERLILNAGSCAAQFDLAPPPETLMTTISFLRSRDCAVTEADMMVLISEVGGRDVVMGHLRDLQDVFFLRMSPELGGALLGERLCSATEGGLVAMAGQVPDLIALDPADRLPFAGSALGAGVLLVERAAASECRLEHAAWNALVDEAWIGEEPTAFISTLLDAGVLALQDEGAIGLSIPLCVGLPAARRAAVREAFAE